MADDSTITAALPVTPARGAKRRWPPSSWTPRRLAVLGAAYAAGLVGMIALKGLYISADRYFLVLLVPAFALGVGRRYIRDFLPFIVLMIGFDFSRGYVATLNTSVLHRGPFYEPMIAADRFLFFGHVPTVSLQNWLWSGHVSAFDNAVASFDHLHFFVPPTLLFLIWFTNRRLFYRGAFTLVVVSFLAVLVFFAFPAAPPWLAGVEHHLHVTYVNGAQARVSSIPQTPSWIESYVPRNAVAAVPSLHAAYALCVFLFGLAWHRRVGYALALYTLGMWFAVIYLGDHYVVDIAAGALLTLVVWWLSARLIRPGGRLERLAGPFPAPITSSYRFGDDADERS